MKLFGIAAGGGGDGSSDVSEDNALTLTRDSRDSRDMIMREIMVHMKAKEERGEHRVNKVSEQMKEMEYRHTQEMTEMKNEIAMLKISCCDAGRPRKNKGRHVRAVSWSRRGVLSMPMTMAFIVGLMLQVLFNNSDWGDAAPPTIRVNKRGHPSAHQQKQKINKSQDAFTSKRADAGWTDNNPVVKPASTMKNIPRLVRRGDDINQQLGDNINSAPAHVQRKRMAVSVDDTPSTPACQEADPEVCGCASVRQADYRGSISTTINGYDCIPWSEDWLKAYPNAGLEDGAFCRNPTPANYWNSWDNRAYCLTVDSYEECNIPWCVDERNVLKSFFVSLNGPQWRRSTNWNVENTNHCDWYGVSCDASNHTIMLNLTSNGLAGKLIESIGTLNSLKVLDLSNNDIKGSIPSEIGWLQNLEYLHISYNSFIGSVPEKVTNLPNLELVHLHGNSLSGYINRAYRSTLISSFIADCGEPSTFELHCYLCTMCCNDDGFCKTEGSYNFSFADEFSNPITAGALFAILFADISFLVVIFYCYDKCKNRTLPASSIRRPSMTEQDKYYALEAIGHDSVYSFFLSESWWGWIFALAVIAMQITVLVPFIQEADNYTWQCLPDSDQCIIEGGPSSFGWTVFGIMMAVHLLKDLINGSKLIKLSGQARHTRNQRIRYFFGGVSLVIVSMFTLYVSAIYNYATAESNTELIKDSVVILFVTDIDELVYRMFGAINKCWTDKTSKAVRAQDFKNDIEELYERIRLLQLQIEESEGNNTKPQSVNDNSDDGSRRSISLSGETTPSQGNDTKPKDVKIEESEGNDTKPQSANDNSDDGSRKSISLSGETTPSQGNDTKPQDIKENSDDGSKRLKSRTGMSGSQSSDSDVSS